MTQNRPSICLVGCGRIGALHARNLSGLANLYFCSRSWQNARLFQRKFMGRGVLADLETALTSAIDAVVIATPPELHAQQVIAALAANKAVLVEKPLCVSPAEVEAIAQALTQADNPLLMVAENYYYKPSLACLKQAIASGVVGNVVSVFVKKLTLQNVTGWKSAHGALLEGGIHFVALISDLFDRAPDDVEAIFPNAQDGQPERHSLMRMVYGNATAELHYSWETSSLTKGVFQHSFIEGTDGRIVFESNGIYVKSSQAMWPTFPGLRDLMGYGAMTDDFLACLQDRTRQPYSNFDRARRDLNVVFDAYKA